MEITDTIHSATKEQLKALVTRIERLEEEKAAIANDITEVLKEAKGNGFNTKALRKIIALRKKAEHERLEEEAILATYMHALGLIPDLDGGRTMIGHNSGAGQVDLEEAIERAA